MSVWTKKPFIQHPFIQYPPKLLEAYTKINVKTLQPEESLLLENHEILGDLSSAEVNIASHKNENLILNSFYKPALHWLLSCHTNAHSRDSLAPHPGAAALGQGFLSKTSHRTSRAIFWCLLHLSCSTFHWRALISLSDVKQSSYCSGQGVSVLSLVKTSGSTDCFPKRSLLYMQQNFGQMENLHPSFQLLNM